LEKSNRPYIIGITGPFGSGKTTAADFFVERGFTKIVLSSFLDTEILSRGHKKVTRKLQQDLGNEWRKAHGPGFLAQKALAYIREHQIGQAIVDGLRNTGEIEVLQKESDFHLLAILANREVRFNRLKDLKRKESLTRELFRALDYRDLGINEKKHGLQVAFCIAMADIFIVNNTTKEALLKKLQELADKML
jgi:dephospho-CoA kinase